MAWQYFIVCLFDFFAAPVMTALLKAFINPALDPWKPLTLEGGGLYHLAMGAIIGVASWSRGKEKIQKMLSENGMVVDTETEFVEQTVINNNKKGTT
jgi:hypothetical protein